jgi:hypothetical protein
VTTYCSSCGTPSSAGASFCSGCGQRVVVPQVNCPTCGQVWQNPPVAQVQSGGLYSQPASNTQAWSAPVPYNNTADLASLPAPAPNLTNFQSFAPPQQVTVDTPIKPPLYGKNFVEGKHCGNCGADIEQGVLECSNCQTSEFAKMPEAEIKYASLDSDIDKS